MAPSITDQGLLNEFRGRLEHQLIRARLHRTHCARYAQRLAWDHPEEGPRWVPACETYRLVSRAIADSYLTLVGIGHATTADKLIHDWEEGKL